MKRTYINIIKAIRDKCTANIMLNCEKLKVFSLNSETRQGCPLLQLLFDLVSKILATEISQGKEIKVIKIGREGLILPQMTLYIYRRHIYYPLKSVRMNK